MFPDQHDEEGDERLEGERGLDAADGLLGLLEPRLALYPIPRASS